MSALSIKYESYFMNMVFEGKSIQHIINEAAKIVDTPIRFSPEGYVKQAICSPGYPKEDIRYIADLLDREEGGFPVYLRLTNKPDVGKPYLRPDDDTGNPRIFCIVLIGSRFFGNISIPQIRKNLTEVDLDFIELLSKAIALSCSVTGQWGYDINEANLLVRILNGSVRTKEEMMFYLGGGNRFDGKKWILLSISIPDQTEEAIMKRALQIIFPKKPIAVSDGKVYMVIDVTENELKEEQERDLNRIAETYSCTIIKSLPYDDLLMSREQMNSLNDHPAMKRGTPGYFQYEDHAEYALFFSTQMKRKRALDTLCGKVNEIICYDREHDTKYYETICAYIKESFSVQKTADSLYTHKNTIQYRLTRIEELFDVDLKDSRQIFSLMLGMSALTYWGETTAE